MNSIIVISKRVYGSIKRQTLSPLQRILRRFDLMAMLTEALSDCNSVLDVGCGHSSPLGSIQKHFKSVGVDAFAPSIEQSKKAGIHDEYHNINALDIDKLFEENSFDCVMSIEMIEHMTKEEGLRHLGMMERIAKKKVIVFTPNGFVPQEAYGGNEWQAHKSGWTTQEMKKCGYEVIGARGWKELRKEMCRIKYRPFALWNFISDVTQVLIWYVPHQAYQIFCVKRKS